MLTEVILEQPSNADSPMDVTGFPTYIGLMMTEVAVPVYPLT